MVWEEQGIAPKGKPVANASFADLKQELEDACEFLRSFTLGRRGYTRRDGITGIQRVSDLCDRRQGEFDTGPDAGPATTAAASGRTRIAAAQARLRGKR
jgi:hypothetical protein